MPAGIILTGCKIKTAPTCHFSPTALGFPPESNKQVLLGTVLLQHLSPQLFSHLLLHQIILIFQRNLPQKNREVKIILLFTPITLKTCRSCKTLHEYLHVAKQTCLHCKEGGNGDHSVFRCEMKQIRTIYGVYIMVSLHTLQFSLP